MAHSGSPVLKAGALEFLLHLNSGNERLKVTPTHLQCHDYLLEEGGGGREGPSTLYLTTTCTPHATPYEALIQYAYALI